MTIVFNSIPVNLRIPGQFIEYDNSRAVQGTSLIPKKALLIGLQLASGTAAANTPTQVPSVATGEAYFGHGSQLAQMIEAFKEANAYTELWAIGMAESGGGTAATGTFVLAGTATEDGNLYTYIGGERIVTAVSSGDAAATAGAARVADVTEYLKTSNLPVSIAGTSTATVTCLHKGTAGNSIHLEVNRGQGEKTPAGLTDTVTDMGDVVAGATDPSLAGPIAAFSDVWYTTIASSLADDTNMDLLETEMASRWGPMEQKDVHAFIAIRENLSDTTTAGNARNSRFTTLIGSLSPTPPWVWAASVAALDEAEPDPARPRQSLQIQGVVAPLAADRFTATERNTLLSDGVSTYTVGTDGTCYVERLITTYQTNAASLPDPSYLNLTTMRTLAALRYSLKARFALRFPRHKLADDGATLPPGQPIVTPSIARSEIIALYKDSWVQEGWVELAGLDAFKAALLVQRNANDTDRLDSIIPPDLMNQLRVFAGQMQFLL
jgi:phage tail sheath gpL-like